VGDTGPEQFQLSSEFHAAQQDDVKSGAHCPAAVGGVRLAEIWPILSPAERERIFAQLTAKQG
jgi:hypothetical protein